MLTSFIFQDELKCELEWSHWNSDLRKKAQILSGCCLMSLSNSFLGWFFWNQGMKGLITAWQELWSFPCLIKVEIFMYFLKVIFVELTAKWDWWTHSVTIGTLPVMIEFGSYTQYLSVFLILHVFFSFKLWTYMRKSNMYTPGFGKFISSHRILFLPVF